MKAIVLNEYGDSSHLKLTEIPEPKPGAGEIKVKVAAAGLNPIDWKLRSDDYKTFMPIQFPFVPGVVNCSGELFSCFAEQFLRPFALGFRPLPPGTPLAE